MDNQGKTAEPKARTLSALSTRELEALLEAVHEVVIVTSRTGSLLFCNSAGRDLLERGEALKLVAGRVNGAHEAGQLALGRAIERACADSTTSAQAIVVTRAAEMPLLVLVQCLDGSGRVVLLARDSRLPPARLVEPLRKLFGLTRSEAEVAVHIAEGESTAQIAVRRSVAQETIKSQIKALAAKLGGVSRSQIAAIVKAVPHTRELDGPQ